MPCQPCGHLGGAASVVVVVVPSGKDVVAVAYRLDRLSIAMYVHQLKMLPGDTSLVVDPTGRVFSGPDPQ